MGWEETIGENFGKEGHYRLDHNNELLTKYLKEYVSYMRSFAGIEANWGFAELVEEFGDRRWQVISINKKYLKVTGFKAYLRYEVDEESKKICLTMDYSIGFDPFGMPVEGRPKDDRSYIFKKEKFFEQEIFEKDYILQLITNRYIPYMEMFENK